MTSLKLTAVGDSTGVATLANLGVIALDMGSFGEAREVLGKTLAMRQALSDRGGEAATWHQLGSIDLAEGSYGKAREKLDKALAMFKAIGTVSSSSSSGKAARPWWKFWS